jgi:hypothetical protein
MNFIYSCKVSAIYGIWIKIKMLNVPGTDLTTVTDWWASSHVGYHVALTKVKIANVATMCSTGGQSRMAPALECSRERARVVVRTRATRWTYWWPMAKTKTMTSSSVLSRRIGIWTGPRCGDGVGLVLGCCGQVWFGKPFFLSFLFLFSISFLNSNLNSILFANVFTYFN